MKQALPGSVDSTQPKDTPPNTVSGKAPSEWVTASSPTVMEAYVSKGIGARATRNTNVPSITAMDERYLVEFVTTCL